ncbi:MAG: hypothetical protein ACO27F_05095 [Beijerinckiaceae bacterium]|jgi:hypothetical protein
MDRGFWAGEALVMVSLVGISVVFAALYAALERVIPFLRGGLGRLR